MTEEEGKKEEEQIDTDRETGLEHEGQRERNTYCQPR